MQTRVRRRTIPIGEVLRILREEDARAEREPEGGTIVPAGEPLELELSQREIDEAEAEADAEASPRTQALTSRRQRSRRGLRVAIATALALSGAAIAAHYAQAAVWVGSPETRKDP